MVKEVKALEKLQKHFRSLNKAGRPLTGQEYRKYYEQVQASLEKIDEKQKLYM